MTDPLFSPLTIGPLTLKNRFIKVATNEGRAKGGRVSRGLADFHSEIAHGGAALSTVAYCAVSPDGRTFPDQVILDAASRADFAALVNQVHGGGAAACAQLTHAGCFTFLPRAAGGRRWPVSASGGFNKLGVTNGRFFKRAMSDKDMEEMAGAFVAGAKLARHCGFDAVELHMGHGYLLSQFLSPLYNKRTDEYGGTITNRLRFPVEVLSRVLDAVGRDMAVIVKFSMTDGHPGGASIEEGIAVARAIEAAGAHMAVLSNGLNAESVSSMFGSNLPASVLRPPRNGVERKVMDWMKISGFDPVAFKELYLMDYARAIRPEVSMPLCYLGGVTSLKAAQSALGEGFEAIGLGRALIHNPSLVSGFKAGSVTRSGCTACNECVGLLQADTGVYCIENKVPDAGANFIPAAQNTDESST